MDVNYIKSFPGIAKIVTTGLGFIVFIISAAVHSDPPRPSSGPRDRSAKGRMAPAQKPKTTIFGLVTLADGSLVHCSVGFPLGLEDFLLAMAIIWTLLSIANLVLFVFFIKQVPQNLLKQLKLGDMIGHVVGGCLLLIAGIMMMAYAGLIHDCFCKNSHPVSDCWDAASLIARFAAGLLCFINGILFFGVAFAIFKAPMPGASDAEGAGQQEQMDNQNPASGGTQPTPKASNQVANQPPPMQPQPVPDNS